VVTVEESQTLAVESELVEGMQFDKGYLSAYMVTDTERLEASYNEPYILITDTKISAIKDILPLLEKMAQTGKKDLVIIAEDVDGEALATLVVNKVRGIFNTLAIKAPSFGDRRKEMLADIAVLTGGTVISEETGLKLEKAELKDLGRASKVISTKELTTIIGGKGKKADIDDRIAQLRKQIEKSDSQYDKEKLKERLGKLSGGVAVIKVGAATESEMKYVKLKIEDAVNATKAAVDEGIVPGGGSALVKAGEKVSAKNIKSPSADISDEFQVGVKILLDSLSAPLKQIAINAGKDDGSVIVEKVRSGKANTGYDANADMIIDDMVAEGIIDPVKVTRTSLERASSAVAILLTTEVAITEEPKKEEDKMTSGMGDMDY